MHPNIIFCPEIWVPWSALKKKSGIFTAFSFSVHSTKIKSRILKVQLSHLHAIGKEKNSRVTHQENLKMWGNDSQNPPAQFLQRYLTKNLNPNMPFSAAHKK
jgi:hypothetical protein